MFKVIVAGSRGFYDYQLLKRKMDNFLKNKEPNTIEIVSGTANGADKLGERYAEERGYAIARFPANWDKYGNRRNAEMDWYADACVVFWDGKSMGSKHMIDLAKKANIPLRVVVYSQH